MSTTTPASPETPPSCSVLDSTPGAVRIQLHPPYASHYFDGHFPGLPVLPGVTLLTWTHHLAVAVGFNCAPNSVKNLKFTQVVKPDTPLVLELTPDKARKRVRFQWLSGAQTCASGMLAWNHCDE